MRLKDREKGGLFYPVEEGPLDYVVSEYVKGGLFFPFWIGNQDYHEHAHDFNGALRFLLSDPVTFSIKGFEEYYSAQEIKLLEQFRKKLLEDINKKVVLIRHGESEANVGLPTSDPASIPLTEKGRQQAEQIAEKLTITPDLIIVSPYLRARQTAEPTIKHFRRLKWSDGRRCGSLPTYHRLPVQAQLWKNAKKEWRHTGRLPIRTMLTGKRRKVFLNLCSELMLC